MVDILAITGTDTFVCQNCGKYSLPLDKGTQQCPGCSQKWKIEECWGDPLANLHLRLFGKSLFIGRTDFKWGWIVQAVRHS